MGVPNPILFFPKQYFSFSRIEAHQIYLSRRVPRRWTSPGRAPAHAPYGSSHQEYAQGTRLGSQGHRTTR